MKKILSVLNLLLVLSFSFPSVAQLDAVENSIFWEVTGNDLAQPSYLFGTSHVLDRTYIDSLGNVLEKFNYSKAFAGEILYDPSIAGQIISNGIMRDSTLEQLLDRNTYARATQWLYDLSGLDLNNFNTLNPATLQLLLTGFVQQKIHPSGFVSMDISLQQRASINKKMIGLETLNDQLYAIYGGMTYKRQAVFLTNFINTRETISDEFIRMNTLYRQQNLEALYNILQSERYTKDEQDLMLRNRNQDWIKQLAFLFSEQSTFVAVGVLHLAGETGLVSLLRSRGYIVRPVSLH